MNTHLNHGSILGTLALAIGLSAVSNSAVLSQANCSVDAAKIRSECIVQACDSNRWTTGGFDNWAHCAENCRAIGDEEASQCTHANTKKPTPNPAPTPGTQNKVQITACTNAAQTVRVAIAAPVGPNVYDVSGYVNVPAKGCATVAGGPIHAPHYFFAFTQNQNFVWPTTNAGTKTFCIAGSNFSLKKWPVQVPAAPCTQPGYANRNLWPENVVNGAVRINFNR